MRHLTSGLGYIHHILYRTFAMAEGSMHTQDGIQDLRLFIPLQHFITLYQMTWNLVILCSHASFEILEIEIDTGSHHSAIDHDSKIA